MMAGTMAALTLVGRLVRDAELKYTTGGQALLNFTVATDKRQKKGEAWGDIPSFWDCVLWGKRAEQLVNYLTKGKLVACQGEPWTDTWEKDGQEHKRIKVDISAVSLLSSGVASQAKQEHPTQETEAHTQPAQQEPEFFDDIPF